MAEGYSDLYHLEELQTALTEARQRLYTPLTDCKHAAALLGAIELHVVAAEALVEKLISQVEGQLEQERRKREGL